MGRTLLARTVLGGPGLTESSHSLADHLAQELTTTTLVNMHHMMDVSQDSHGTFLHSTVFSPSDFSEHFTLHPWQTCSFRHHIDFSGKHSASLQLLCEGNSFTYLLLIYTAERTEAMWSE